MKEGIVKRNVEFSDLFIAALIIFIILFVLFYGW